MKSRHKSFWALLPLMLKKTSFWPTRLGFSAVVDLYKESINLSNSGVIVVGVAQYPTLSKNLNIIFSCFRDSTVNHHPNLAIACLMPKACMCNSTDY